MDNLLGAVLGTLISLTNYVTNPTTLHCPRGFLVEGVRPNGATRCYYDPTVQTQANFCGKGGGCDGSGLPRTYIPIRLYCTTTLAVVNRDGSISCSRNAWPGHPYHGTALPGDHL